MTLLEETNRECVRDSHVPVIETERLVLRLPRPADAGAIAALINDRRIAENTSRVPHPYTLADAEQWIGAVNKTGGEAAFLVTLADGTLIGGCSIIAPKGDHEPGYWIGAPYWGQGYATEAARAIIDHAFGALGHTRLQARARVSNPASRRVLEKCGFQWSGAGLIRVRALGTSVPVDRFRLDRRLWASLRSWGKVRSMA